MKASVTAALTVRLPWKMPLYFVEGVCGRAANRKVAVVNASLHLEGVRDRGASRKVAVVNANISISVCP